MRVLKRESVSGVIVALCAAMLGCSGGADQQAKEITPGQFVIDEPIQIAQHEFKKSGKCIIDSINAKAASKEQTWEIKHGEKVVISGWAFSKDGGTAPSPLFIQLTGDAQTYYAVSSTRMMRPDVNQLFQLNASLTTGFDLQAQTENIEPGAYEIMILQVNGTTVEGCNTKTMLLVD